MVRIAGKQHLVSPGDRIKIDSHLGEAEEELNFKEVLLTSVGDQMKLGTPLVEKTKVTAKVLSKGRGEKIRVAKFKAKSRYRRVMGFRPNQTTLEITGIK